MAYSTINRSFGPCGIGWKIQNLSYSYKEVCQEIVCNCYLELLFKYNNEWSEPIPASGGNKLATMERNGLYVSDEAERWHIQTLYLLRVK